MLTSHRVGLAVLNTEKAAALSPRARAVPDLGLPSWPGVPPPIHEVALQLRAPSLRMVQGPSNELQHHRQLNKRLLSFRMQFHVGV